MKRMISLMLACVSMFAMVATAQATPFYLEAAGVSIEVPEGMTAQDMSTEASFLLGITVGADPSLKFAYALSYVEEFEDKYIEDLTEDEGNMLMQSIAASIEDPQFGATEIDEYKLLLVASGDGSQLHFISLLGGWLCDVAVGRSDSSLTDDDIQAAADLLLSIQFEEDDASADYEEAE